MAMPQPQGLDVCPPPPELRAGILSSQPRLGLLALTLEALTLLVLWSWESFQAAWQEPCKRLTIIFLLHTKGRGWGFPNLSVHLPHFSQTWWTRSLAWIRTVLTSQGSGQGSDNHFKLLGGTASAT